MEMAIARLRLFPFLRGSQQPGAEGAGRIWRFRSPPTAKSLRNPYIPAPKAPGEIAISGSRKGQSFRETLYPGAEGAGEFSRFKGPQKAKSLRNPPGFWSGHPPDLWYELVTLS